MKTNGKRQKVLYFKVTLSDEGGRVRSRPYRIIAAPGALSLYSFAQVIAESFNLKFDRPFGFYSSIKGWRESTLCYESSGTDYRRRKTADTKKVKIQQLFARVNEKMLFLFDTNLYFVLQLKRIEEYPRILEWEGESPSAKKQFS
jgi:hypothetical protein